MPDANTLFIFPRANTAGILLVAGISFALLVIAVIVELLRRRAQRSRDVQRQWSTFDEIARDKELSTQETTLLRSLIKRCSPANPIDVVTVRHEFDRCVSSEMARLESARDDASFRRIGAELRDIRSRLALDYIPLGQRIFSTRELYQGQHMWMAHAQGERPLWYRFRVVSLDEAYFFAVREDEGEGSPDFRAGEDIRCRMWREDDARYAFTVGFARLDQEPPTWVFTHSEKLERLQAREHFRVRFDHNVQVGILNAPLDGSYDDVRTRRAVTKLRGRMTSLSAGGCAIVLPQATPKQVLLRVLLEMPEGKPLELEAAVVGTTQLSGGRYLVRARFIATDEESTDQIARYVLHRQQPVQAASEAAE